jgi:hypothetical protein
MFASLAWLAVQAKSPTVDEPMHAAAGWLNLRYGEFRSDSEHPPLWKYWANLPNLLHPIHCDLQLLHWEGMPLGIGAEWVWQTHTLYHTPGNDAIGFVRRCRAMMLSMGVALGGLLATCTWYAARTSGAAPRAAAVATIVATALFSFDPNFLAHAPLMKNDVAIALAMLAVVACAWAAGRRLTVTRVVALGLACAIALGVKYTGVLICLIAIGLLIVRALLPWPWAVGKTRMLTRRAPRLTAAAVAGVSVGAICYVSIWLFYCLRFAPGADGQSLLDLSGVKHAVIVRKWQAEHYVGPELPIPTSADLASERPPLLLSFSEFTERHRLLPQAWISGLLVTYQGERVRRCYLCGEMSWIGWWWYFPLAMLVKTPLATILAGLMAAVAAAFALLRGRRRDSTITSPLLWTGICLAGPVAVYMACAMSSHLNLGIRYVLTVYPLLFMAIGLIAGHLSRGKATRTRWVMVVLGVMLAAESISVFPDYIPFFNAAAGGSRGGLRLLSDSNLDWGQDVGLLSLWQQEHPSVRLYYCCVGSVDPAYFGLQYVNVHSGYMLGPPTQPIDSAGVIAISASKLQGLYAARPDGRPYYDWLFGLRPIDVLGGSIYLFRVPPQAEDQLPAGKWLISPVPH